MRKTVERSVDGQMNSTKTKENLMRKQVIILYEELIKIKLFIIEILQTLKASEIKDDQESGLYFIKQMEGLNLEKWNIQHLYDKMWCYWMGNIKKEDLIKHLQVIYNQISEAERCFKVQEIFSEK